MKNKKLAFESLRSVLAIAISLAIALVTILLVSDVPGVALKAFLFGPLDSMRHFGNVLEMMIPLVFTGLAVSIMFSAAQFNLGAEGAFFMGAVVSSFVAVQWTLPVVIHPIVSILVGGLTGAVFCGIPALLKVKWGASELVSSLMFNYIAFFFGLYLINYFLRDPNAGAMVSYKLLATAKLPFIIPNTRVHFGIIIAVLAIVVMYFFNYRTRWGYKTRLTGLNSLFAEYSGIKTAAVVISAQLIGGFIAGAGGSIELLGLYRRFSWQQLPGYGWSGVIVAILARRNPAYIPLAAFFLAYLRIGADLMSRQSDVQNEIVAIIQGVMIVLIAAAGFLEKAQYKMVFRDATKDLADSGKKIQEVEG
ncbi:MAG: ABC transporter permease [Bacteroidetes bacterium]|nr:ABC transporter permease [Bacteroidota bacterium]